MKSLSSLLSLVLFSGMASVATGEVFSSTFRESINLKCSISTRVIAAQYNVGIDPIGGILEFDINKYHAFSEGDNFHLSGSNAGTHESKVSINNSVDLITISASGSGSYGNLQGPHDISIVMKKTFGRVNRLYLASFLVDGTEYMKDGTTWCEVTKI